jgi:hypothetical protein
VSHINPRGNHTTRNNYVYLRNASSFGARTVCQSYAKYRPCAVLDSSTKTCPHWHATPHEFPLGIIPRFGSLNPQLFSACSLSRQATPPGVDFLPHTPCRGSSRAARCRDSDQHGPVGLAMSVRSRTPAKDRLRRVRRAQMDQCSRGNVCAAGSSRSWRDHAASSSRLLSRPLLGRRLVELVDA